MHGALSTLEKYKWNNWITNENAALSVKQKVSNTKKKYWDSPESDSMREHLSTKSKENGSKPPSRKGKIPWNKGLTKDTDPRVLANAIAISKPKANTDKMGRYVRKKMDE